MWTEMLGLQEQTYFKGRWARPKFKVRHVRRPALQDQTDESSAAPHFPAMPTDADINAD